MSKIQVKSEMFNRNIPSQMDFFAGWSFPQNKVFGKGVYHSVFILKNESRTGWDTEKYSKSKKIRTAGLNLRQ